MQGEPMLEIVTFGSEILTAKARPVAEMGSDVRILAEEMFGAMERGRGVGLAAPQVGSPVRVFVTNIEGDQKRVFINPEIVLTSQEQVEFEEGCLSLPRLYLDVTRPESVRVQAWNERGRPFTVEADGFLARVMLHEYDHLEGILFIDRLSAAKREKAIIQYRKLSKG
jgi:peptide deformylase